MEHGMRGWGLLMLPEKKRARINFIRDECQTDKGTLIGFLTVV